MNDTKKKIKGGLLILIHLLLSFAGIAQIDNSITFDPSSFKGVQGYFRVAKSTEGQWWLITPENKPFFYKGVCAVNRAGTQGGRRAMPGPYAVTIDRKYNYQMNPDGFVDASIEKIHGLGFNALGAWSTEEFFDRGIPFTEILEFFNEPPFLPSVNNKRGLPDIFHPDWLIAIDKKARALCTRLRNSRDLVGYFTDNEIGFGKADDFGLDLGFQAGQFDFALLRLLLGMKADEPAREFAWNFLLKRYNNSFEQLSNAWQVKITTKEDLQRLNETKVKITGKGFAEDAQAFVQLYAERYFKLANQTIRRYDPNHLILGCRFGAPPPTYVLDAIKPWTDIISANNYQPILYERYDTVYRYTGMPLLIGEFSWNTDLYKKIPYPEEIAQPLSVKERMFRKGKSSLIRTAMHEGIVGYTWYRWVDGTSNEESFFSGIVNKGDSLDMHSEELKLLNPLLEKYRLTASSGLWKNSKLNNGEMSLFFDQLRPDWGHYLRISFKKGKPEVSINGWKMAGNVINFSAKDSTVSLKLKITFEDASAINKAYEGGNGIYELTITRSGEKYFGSFKGTYNRVPVTGKVHAFYFPEL